jgi:UDP-N-acetylmuramyl tripeptide synthase
MVLQNPRVDFAVMEVARGGILREGLGYDRNDVAVVTNVAPDHLGMRGIDTLEQLADVKAVVVEAVPRDGLPCSTPTTRSCVGCGGAARARSCGSASPNPAVERARVHRRPLPPRWARGGPGAAPTEAT